VSRLTFTAGLLAGIALAAGLSSDAQKAFPDVAWPFAVPAWTATPATTLQVRWIRVEGIPQFEIRDGVCVIYAADTDEAALHKIHPLLDGCARTGKAPATGFIAGTVQMYWHRVDQSTVLARSAELWGERSRVRAGLYYHPDPKGPCHVVAAEEHLSAGHELKHCFDGAFHDGKGRWYR
jgi:hypothetical protein